MRAPEERNHTAYYHSLAHTPGAREWSRNNWPHHHTPTPVFEERETCKCSRLLLSSFIFLTPYSPLHNTLPSSEILTRLSSFTVHPSLLHQNQSNDEVIRLVVQGRAVLPRPRHTPTPFSRLMRRCWRYESKFRPAFLTITKFLLKHTSPEYQHKFEQVSFYHSRANDYTRLPNDRGKFSLEPSCCIKVNSEGESYVPLTNLTKRPLCKKPGQILGTSTVIDEVDIRSLKHVGERQENLALPTLQSEKTIVATVGHVDNALLPTMDEAHYGVNQRDHLQSIVKELEWPHLPESQKKELTELILDNHELFILDAREIGTLKVAEAHLDTIDSDAVRMPLYRHPENSKKAIAEIIEEMIEKDVNEESTAAYLAPIVLVSKPDGSKRMCIDYRGLNKKVKVDIQPLPRLDELVEEGAGKKYYCVLDMKDAYLQVRPVGVVRETVDLTQERTETHLLGLTVWKIKEAQRKDSTWNQVIRYLEGSKLQKKMSGMSISILFVTRLPRQLLKRSRQMYAEKTLNEAVHTSLGTSPFFAFYGRHPNRELGELQFPEDEDCAGRLNVKLLLKETLHRMTSKYLRQANEGRKNNSITAGELVWVYLEESLPGTASKLNRKWEGPYKIIRNIDGGRAYELENVFDGTILRRAGDKIKRYVERNTLLRTVEQKFLTKEEEEEVLPTSRTRKPPDRLQYT
ncbi:hypothetical protein Pcinc_014602 [Petrolisthes cinctipes]|uniref:Serine-threonine/tyrosine-protein kinase catalytic domain-containing protein n=1 Tax=Petrolisthes cinctipes TaxID=88211 RepID=A0AAE1FXI2_PETCI|nr:hypothetical protein Pcinc_014602 [Petrolisthes cinctipes]